MNGSECISDDFRAGVFEKLFSPHCVLFGSLNFVLNPLLFLFSGNFPIPFFVYIFLHNFLNQIDELFWSRPLLKSENSGIINFFFWFEILLHVVFALNRSRFTFLLSFLISFAINERFYRIRHLILLFMIDVFVQQSFFLLHRKLVLNKLTLKKSCKNRSLAISFFVSNLLSLTYSAKETPFCRRSNSASNSSYAFCFLDGERFDWVIEFM